MNQSEVESFVKSEIRKSMLEMIPFMKQKREILLILLP